MGRTFCGPAPASSAPITVGNGATDKTYCEEKSEGEPSLDKRIPYEFGSLFRVARIRVVLAEKMPWLVKPKAEQGEAPLLFVHVPRCGGTSLAKLFNVKSKAQNERNLWHKVGLLYFFYRYTLLEKANFPLKTFENGIVAMEILIAFSLWFWGLVPSIESNCDAKENGWTCSPGIPSIVMWCSAGILFISSTILFTAPISGRIGFMRRAYMFFVGNVMCNFTEAHTYLTGVSSLGYVVHFTAEKMVRYQFVTEEEFNSVDSFAIVRNPYSRMVSVFLYNKFLFESFDHFVHAWFLKWKKYKNTNTEEENVYCHVLPMFEFTHHRNHQLVKCVIKQEDLRAIVNDAKNVCLQNGQRGDIPPRILKALKDMPHSNRRTRSKPWQDFFTEETMALVLEMYGEDFEVFGYDRLIPGRSELDFIATQARATISSMELDSDRDSCKLQQRHGPTGSDDDDDDVDGIV